MATSTRLDSASSEEEMNSACGVAAEATWQSWRTSGLDPMGRWKTLSHRFLGGGSWSDRDRLKPGLAARPSRRAIR